MRRTTTRSLVHAGIAMGCLLLACGAAPARAGQVRVDVGVSGQLTFTPYAVNINAGDHVVWVWRTPSHTVTSWKLPDDSISSVPDGATFNSSPSFLGQPATTRFSWKSPDTLDVPYVCAPHASAMSGRVIISNGPKVPVADFRITEVLFNDPLVKDLIEIANLGQAAGNLGRFRIAVLGTGTGVELAFNDFPVPSFGRVTIHTNESGPNDATNIFLPGLGNLGDGAGSIALYVPYSLAPGNALTNDKMMIDFVQWGAGGQPNEGTADLAGFWSPGTSINDVAVGHSIEYCEGSPYIHGVNQWREISPPNFGTTSHCTTPTRSESWGRLKIIYRQ